MITRPRARRFNRDAAVLVVYFLLALVSTYPLVTQLTTHGPGHGVDDPAQTWSLWWFKYALFDLGANPLQTDFIFYPLGINLAAYTPTFLNGLLSIPLQFVAGVIVAQNLIVYFALVAGGYGAFLLAREVLSRSWVDSDLGAALAGAVYAFGAWHINYVIAGHFMLLSNAWIPFYALYLLRFDRQSWRSGALAGLFFALAAWTELTFALFLGILTLLYLCYIAVTTRRGNQASQREHLFPRRSDGAASLHSITLSPAHRVILSNLGTLAAVALVLVSPLGLNLLNDMRRYGYYLASGVGRVQIFSAEPISFLVPSSNHPLLGAWADKITTAQTAYAFIGWAALLLAVIGFWTRRKTALARFWAALALVFAVIMLGATLYLGGRDTGIPMPFALLRTIPFVNANRYPVRFNVLLMLALGPLIAFGAARLAHSARGRLAFGGLVVLFAFEQLVLPIPLSDLRVPAVFNTLRDEPGDFSILELPLGWRGSVSMQGQLDDRAQFFQTVHGKRLLGGITSRTPPFKFQYFLESPVLNSLIALESGRDLDETRRAQDRAVAPEVLRFFGIRYVDVNRRLTAPALLDYALDVFPLTEVYRDDERIVYRVAALTPLKQIDQGAETSTLYFDDAWGRPVVASDGSVCRWATRGDSVIWLPLAPAATSLTLRWRGIHAGQKITLRVNGSTVAEATITDTWSDQSMVVPAAVLRDGLNEFAFLTETGPLENTGGALYTIGDTGVVSPVDISVTGAGFDAGRFGEIYVAGRSMIPGRRGYHLVAVNPRTGSVDAVDAFDTFGDPAASARLVRFVSELPAGEIVAGAAVDDVSQNLQSAAVDALRQLGVDSDLRYQFRTGHAFIGVKGAAPGQALERTGGRMPANVAVGKNVAGDRAAFALCGITISTPDIQGLRP